MNNVKMKWNKKSINENKTLIPVSYFWIFFGVLLLIGGFHMGLFYLLDILNVSPLAQTHLMLLYWIVVALLLVWIARRTVRKTYDEPLQRLADASRQVAEGDFSVYVPTVHSSEKYDYLDYSILDFNKMVEELGSIETLKTDFFANVSHEIKTPLAIISNNTQLLARPGLDEVSRADYTENILSASRRLNNLITNMLKLNKLEKQTIKPAPESYDVCRQLAESVFQYEELMEEKQLELQTDLEERCFVQADSELMELVWTNLMSNAVKFTPTGGTITMTQRTEGTFACITISDTGCGMDEETRKHIFDKFYQGDTSHAMQGNGLGLALVKRILELSDGTIEVESKPGEGSSFIVHVPLMTLQIKGEY
jgi:signal transduction histidine kinase